MVNDKCFVPPPRVQRLPPGPTQSTSTSGRSVSTPSPTGLATCPWSTLSFAWTLCFSKIKCPSCARNTRTWRGREKLWTKWTESLGKSSIEVWSSGLPDSQMDQLAVDSQGGPLKTVWDVGKVPVLSNCDMDKGQSSDRPRRTVLDIRVKRKWPIKVWKDLQMFLLPPQICSDNRGGHLGALNKSHRCDWASYWQQKITRNVC